MFIVNNYFTKKQIKEIENKFKVLKEIEINNNLYKVLTSKDAKEILKKNNTYKISVDVLFILQNTKFNIQSFIIQMFGESELLAYNNLDIVNKKAFKAKFYYEKTKKIESPSSFNSLSESRKKVLLGNSVLKEFGEEEYNIYMNLSKEERHSYYFFKNSRGMMPSEFVQKTKENNELIDNTRKKILNTFGEHELLVYDNLSKKMQINYAKKYINEQERPSKSPSSYNHYSLKIRSPYNPKKDNLSDKMLRDTYKEFGKSFTDKTIKKFTMLLKNNISKDDLDYYLSAFDRLNQCKLGLL